MAENRFLTVYFEDFIQVFRQYNKDTFAISVSGLDKSVADDTVVSCLLDGLKGYDIVVTLREGAENADLLKVEFSHTGDLSEYFDFSLANTQPFTDIAEKSGLPLAGVILMRVVAKVLCQVKVLYKALVVDLDDTLWPGTLAEDGFEAVCDNLRSQKGVPFVRFMRFVRGLAEELGIFVALCTRNDLEKVQSAIENLDESVFPLKNQFDCLIANHNDKGDNIRAIAEDLSILPNAIVFIDDNRIERDKVRKVQPEVLVPEWDNHESLITLLEAGCFFERFEIGRSRERRKQFKIIKAERKNNPLLPWLISVSEDAGHSAAKSLYAKSNQFTFVPKVESDLNAKSLFYEIFRENGDSIGVCSAITYHETDDALCVLNWAISCRYFGIGLEEFVLLHLGSLAGEKRVYFRYQKTELNKQVTALFNKYPDAFKRLDDGCLVFDGAGCVEELKNGTNLRWR